MACDHGDDVFCSDCDPNGFRWSRSEFVEEDTTLTGWRIMKAQGNTSKVTGKVLEAWLEGATGYVWEGPELTAQCSGFSGMTPHHLSGQCPNGSLACGIYAMSEPPPLQEWSPKSLVKVSLGGIVRESTHGYRSEFALIEEIHITCSLSGDFAEQKRLLEERYDCPVYFHQMPTTTEEMLNGHWERDSRDEEAEARTVPEAFRAAFSD